MTEIALGCLDKIRDQALAAFELDLYLGKPILIAIGQRDELIVDDDPPEDSEGNDAKCDPSTQFHSFPLFFITRFQSLVEST